VKAKPKPDQRNPKKCEISL